MLPRLIGLWVISSLAWVFSCDPEWGPIVFVGAFSWMVICLIGANRDARGVQ